MCLTYQHCGHDRPEQGVRRTYGGVKTINEKLKARAERIVVRVTEALTERVEEALAEGGMVGEADGSSA